MRSRCAFASLRPLPVFGKPWMRAAGTERARARSVQAERWRACEAVGVDRQTRTPRSPRRWPRTADAAAAGTSGSPVRLASHDPQDPCRSATLKLKLDHYLV